MPLTALAITEAIDNREIDNITLVAGDNVNGMHFVNTGEIVLIVRNPTAGSLTMTVVSVADRHGRTGDLSVVVPAAGTGFVSLLQPELWNQKTGTTAGSTHLTFSAAGLTVAALRVA